MKAISVLGTSSNAGKSWVSTALCAWLRLQGVKVAPFKAQNMANNAFATLGGGEIGVAQAVQAEACDLLPRVEMNPILLKPNGPDGSQIVRLGVAGETTSARDYYTSIENSWTTVRETLDYWKAECEVLVLEGAGSPVELNLMNRDIVNLRPVEYLDGRWLLVSNIEYGGVFAQVLGTWNLMPDVMKPLGMGVVVNRFRGDLSLFDGAKAEIESRSELPYLGVLPFDSTLAIDDEDSLNAVAGRPRSGEPYIAWVKYPRVSNSQDQLPWRNDAGVQSVWTESPDVVRDAAAVVLPGSKNTLADLAWLKERGLADAVQVAARAGRPVVGICGGKQMLGRTLFDPASGESAEGLGLLPLESEFLRKKRVVRNEARYEGQVWETFEIHTGESRWVDASSCETLLEARKAGEGAFRADGIKLGKVWGSYQHGLFDAAEMRQRLVVEAGIGEARICEENWKAKRALVYARMAESLDRYLDLDTVKRYLGL
ncbi:cobyric acid synthase [Pelagicoccus sp. SDUM812005]|uniref:cobyric acid synthase n=1 Tax=Pelagicoccus sp. SDUM812005 TaxID=3041257 RepID=UPI00280F34DB|nr:cobyric acid synthase [Pelagicoccus sp. SDUM812005]MDQ8182499.1 cobyric acid synthase [Pelagicoccus sp. SDUM812005]